MAEQHTQAGGGSSMSSEQSAALAALAAHCHMANNPMLHMYQSPFMHNLNSFYPQQAHAGGGGWTGSSQQSMGEYMMNVAAWQQVLASGNAGVLGGGTGASALGTAAAATAAQTQPAAAAAGSNDSFSDTLAKLGASMQQTKANATVASLQPPAVAPAKPSSRSAADNKSHQSKSSSSRSSQQPTASCSSSKLDALASLATQLTGSSSSSSNAATTSATQKRTHASPARHSNGNGTSTSSSSKHARTATVDNNSSSGGGNQQQQQQSAELLEASARAWLTLTNQYLLGLQQQLTSSTDAAAAAGKAATAKAQCSSSQSPRRSGSSCANAKSSAALSNGHASGSSSKRKQQQATTSRGRPATISTSETPKSTCESRGSLDDAIDSVLRQASCTPAAKSDCAEMPLDLSVKLNGDASTHRETGSEASTDGYCSPGMSRPRKPAIDQDLIRIPLAHKWRRQTSIRALTAAGVRGDVVYYAPCGKRLASSTDVLRYLKKHLDEPYSREHFSFSSRLLIGEFLQNDGSETGGAVQLDEADVTLAIEQLCANNSARLNHCANESTSVKDSSDSKPPCHTVDQVMEDMLQAAHPQPSCTPSSNEADAVKHEPTPTECTDDAPAAPPKKQIRTPLDDLDLDYGKSLPDLQRLPGLCISSQAFADLLMVMEFIQTFGHVLKIDVADMPRLDQVHAGVLNERGSVTHARKLCKVLLTLVLEYPGLPAGPRGKTCLGQAVKEVGVKKHNYSQLLRLFLVSRDDQGKQLGALLEGHGFESLLADQKAAILAYMCNDLLYCRNVVREIEGNIDEVAKIKGEKWMVDGKLRLVRNLQAKKRVEQSADEVKLEPVEPEPVKEESEETEDDKPESSSRLPLGITIPADVVTDEEKAMSVDELDGVADRLECELGEFRERLRVTNAQVRTQCLGMDRYHRIYWQLPHQPGILVEGADSAGQLGDTPPAMLARPSCDQVQAEVQCVLSRLLDRVANTHKVRTGRKRSIGAETRFGWWTMGVNDEHMERLKGSLLSRGVRERLLNRQLVKLDEPTPEQHTSLSLTEVRHEECVSEAELNLAALKLVRDILVELEDKVLHANVHSHEWRLKQLSSGSGLTLTAAGGPPGRPVDAAEHDYHTLLDSVKQRLARLEEHIERRYLRAAFNPADHLLPATAIMANGEATADDAADTSSEHAASAFEPEDESDCSDKVAVDLVRWRRVLSEASSASTVMLCLQQLDSQIAWERSVMRAFCQICRSGEDESQLLLCDCCDKAYHTYCFKPIMPQVPAGDWYCPKCVAAASGEPCCVICRKQHDGRQMCQCQQCQQYYHASCSAIAVPAINRDVPQRSWTCASCKKHKLKTGKSGEQQQQQETSATGGDANVRQPAAAAAVDGHSQTGTPEPAARAGAAAGNAAAGKKPRGRPPASANVNGNCNGHTATNGYIHFEELCSIMLAELDAHKDAWPFKQPVDTRACPLYRQVIQRPIDLSTVQKNLQSHKYQTEQQFLDDVKLIFTNCKIFNEDDSPIGRAGQTIRRFFNRRWKELKSGVKTSTARGRKQLADANHKP